MRLGRDPRTSKSQQLSHNDVPSLNKLFHLFGPQKAFVVRQRGVEREHTIQFLTNSDALHSIARKHLLDVHRPTRVSKDHRLRIFLAVPRSRTLTQSTTLNAGVDYCTVPDTHGPQSFKEIQVVT